jgi:DNA/RNA-binding domain of Phe-tRNA-synthetase-like protein
VEAGAVTYERGWIAPEIAAEFPDLELVQLTVAVGSGRTSPSVRERLRYLSQRMNGAEAVAFRTRPIPHAYRVLFRHLGMDPDEQRPPGEAVVVQRLVKGQYKAQNRLDDAITVAVAETGVPVWGLDEERLDGPLGLRAAQPCDTLGEGELVDELPAGRLVVADGRQAVGVLFGSLAPSHVVTKQTETTRLFAVRAPGVPAIHLDEALHIAVECLTTG